MRRLDLASISLTNFRSFVHCHLDFPSRPGLTFLSGPNGAGKSSFIDAYLYAAYDSSVEGLKGGDLCTIGANPKRLEARIILSEQEKDNLVIQRTWDRGKLTNPNPSDLRALKLDRQQCLNSVIFGQGQPLFVDLDPSARLVVFEELLSLYTYSGAAERAKELVKSIEAAITRLNIAKARQEGRREQLPSEEILAKEVEESQNALNQYVVELTQRHNSLTSELDATIRSHGEHVQALAELAAKISETDETKTLVDEAEKEINALRAQLHSYDFAIKQQEKELESLETTTICYACKQPLPEGNRQVEIDLRRQSIAELSKTLSATDNSINENAVEVTNAKSQLAEREALIGERGEIQANLNALRQRKLSLEESLKQQDSGRDRLQQNLDSAKGRLKHTQDTRAIIDRRLFDIGKCIEKLNGRIEEAEILVSSFRDMRLVVVGRVLDHLTLEANSLLTQLGLYDTRVRFDSKSTSKSTGNQRARLTITVERNGTELPFHAYSGGERQRLRIACSMGLSNVIQAIAGVYYGFEVWDEPSSWLSPEGVGTLLQVLSDRATRYKKRVVIMDHRAIDFADFDHVVILGKDETGKSRIVESRIFNGE